MSNERRRHQRFNGKEGAYAALMRPDHSFDLGKIVDISKGGVCISYLATGEKKPDNTEIKIFGMNGHFIHLDRIRCDVVYDVQTDENMWTVLVTKRCGVRFRELSDKHQVMLETFIQDFSAGEAV